MELHELKRRFEAEFGVAPTAHVRAPGRVNLIGDHTDYNGLPVLPMALDQAIHGAYRARDDTTVRVASTLAEFQPTSFSLGSEIERARRGDWSNYTRAAAQGLCLRAPLARGIDLLVHGEVPVASGLSSSSALVVATGLALLDANGESVPPLELMDLFARAERYVGLQGGGMDQAVCVGARAGSALHIDFEPLALTPVDIPSGWKFVVASTGIRAEKSGMARDAYNLRTVECRDALRGLRIDGAAPDSGYGELFAQFGADALVAAATRTLAPPMLLARFRHVVTEGERVAQAVDALRANAAERFGALMNASHASLRDDFSVSCAELDALVGLSLGAGALGARLTGAGFGGCIVALAPPTGPGELLSALRQHHLAFVATPCAGATIQHASLA